MASTGVRLLLVWLPLLAGCLPPGSQTFEVPSGTGGAQVVLRKVPREASVTLISPSGRRVSEQSLFVSPIVDRDLRSYMLTNPYSLVEEGQWRVEVSPAEPYELSTRLSPELAEGEWGVVDLRFVLASGCVDVQVARRAVEDALSTLRASLFSIGLELGEVAFEEREARPCSLTREWAGVLTEFATPQPELVFVVSGALEIEELGGYAPVGGTVGEAGSPFGVGALSAAALSLGSVTPTSIVLHELGHWAGLTHSIERNGLVDDRQGVRCEPWTDLDVDGEVDLEECSPAGYNFMFWASTGLAMTEVQVLQLRRALTMRVIRH